jgi:large subunit ribosomal protein L29
MKNNFNDMKMDELSKVHDDLLIELRELRFREVVGELNDPLRKRNVRRSIARAKTIMHEHVLGIRKNSDEAGK